LLRGRFLSEDDVSTARHVAVINEAFAHRYFPNEDPIGHKVKFGNLDLAYVESQHDIYFEIVGIAPDFKTRDDTDSSWKIVPQAFMPYSVAGYSWRSFIVKSAMDSNLLLKNIGQELGSLDPGVEMASSGTLEVRLKEFYRGPQFALITLAAFAFTGLALVVIGIFSVMAYAVSLRTREIGIRVALGAQQGNILRLILVHGFRLILAGIFLGLFASYALTRFVSSQIHGISATDPWTFAFVAMIVAAVGTLACFLPARRAASQEPLIALRCE
jgi:ABC-type antimicrobial peptide transport system permease subunit